MKTLEQIRELTILAAKAMGFKTDRQMYCGEIHIAAYCDGRYIHNWNPRTNAEQLNEMRAKLGIDTTWLTDSHGAVIAVRCFVISFGMEKYGSIEPIHGYPTPQAAEAMAALRVAAQIGEAQ